MKLDEEMKDKRKKKQGITCKFLKGGRAYKFIAEAVAMKGTSTYISETMLAKFLAKELKGCYVDTAKEIADAALLQMKNVKEKGQKLIKCGHVWVGLYRQAATLAAKAATIHLDTSRPPSPNKMTQQPAESSGDKKRKAEAASLELISKKPKPTAVAIELPLSTAGDNWKTLLERKRLEKLNKEKNLLSSQTTSQHSIRLPEGQVSQVQVLKDDEVSQFKKLETKKTEPKLSKQ